MGHLSNVRTFRAFRSLNYSLYFAGRSVSQFGTWMQRTAVVWVVYSITHSAFMLGLTIFAEQFPSFLLSVFGGIAADRYNRYKIIKITQILSMIQASLLALLIITGHYVLWQILVLSVLLGIINAFDVPARQSMIHEVLNDPNDLPNALSLNSAMASVARLLGPAASGIILENFGAGICFLLNAASFGGVILSLVFMKLPAVAIAPTKKKVWSDLLEGFVYLKKASSIGYLIVILAMVNLMVVPYDTLLPVYAKVIFKGSAATYGYITSFIGLGAVSGTVLLASLNENADLKKLLLICTVILGGGLLAFSYLRSFPLAMLFAVITGLGTVAQNTITNIIIQSESTPSMRGRVISIMIMAMFGMLPIGSLMIGAISQKIGAPATVFGQGLSCLIIAAIFFRFLRTGKLTQQTEGEYPIKTRKGH